MPPRNRKTRAERLALWKAAGAAADVFKPERLTGKKHAQIEYLKVMRSENIDLGATARHVGMALALFGNSDGARIYPGTQRLAGACQLSERTVSTALDRLVRSGFLARKPRGAGFTYVLYRPTVLKEIQHSESMLKELQHSADAVTKSAEVNDTGVLKQLQPTELLPNQRPNAASRPDTPDGPRPDARSKRAADLIQGLTSRMRS